MDCLTLAVLQRPSVMHSSSAVSLDPAGRVPGPGSGAADRSGPAWAPGRSGRVSGRP